MNRRLEKINRASYFKKIGLNQSQIITADSIHSDHVQQVGEESGGKEVSDSDGLVTSTKNLFLTATAGDCFLLYLYDPSKSVVSIVHASWRGIVAGVVQNAVRAVMSAGSNPKDILVGVRPGIRACHFEISPKDVEKFQDYSDYILKRQGKIFVDLPGIINFQLQESGIPAEQIEDVGVCTFDDRGNYFSFRRDKPKVVEVMVGYIGMV